MQCKTGSYSQLSTKCQNCVQKDSCNNKRMEAVAYIIPNEPTSLNNAIKIDIGIANTENITEALMKSLERKLCCSFNKSN